MAEVSERRQAGQGQQFVGRDEEMERLRSALQQTISGQGCITMLVGEPGIGKTRTAEELASYAEEQNTEVLWGRCYEGEGAPLCWPWVQVVRGYVHYHSPDELRQHMGAGAATIAVAVPQVAEHLPDLPPLRTIDDPVSARFRLFDSITTFLKSAAHARPIVIVLDDLHWADTPSLLLLEFIAHEIKDSCLLILVTYRDVERSRKHPLHQTLGDLARERPFERIPLKGLSCEEVAEFIRNATDIDPSQELARQVFEQSEGNPLFVGEIVHLLVQEGEFLSGRSCPGSEPNTRIPEGVREAIGRRLNRLSESCNELLTLAAVVGRDFSLSLLKALKKDLTEEQILGLLDEALSTGMVTELPDCLGCFRFHHALTQQTLVEELSVTRRIHLHARIARTLEEVYGEEAEEHSPELVEHFARAETVLGTEKLVRYLLLAGEQALKSYAHEDAGEYFRQGLAAKEGRPMDEEIADLLYGLGRAQAAMLDEDAIESFSRAFDYYEKNGITQKAVAVASYPLFREPRGSEGASVDLCERALRLVDDDTLDAARVMASLARALCCMTGGERGRPVETGGERGRPAELYERALRVARREGDVSLEMRIQAYWSVTTEDLDAARTRSEQALDLARRCDDLRGEALVLFASQRILRWQGKADQSRECAIEFLRAAEKLRDRFLLSEAWHANKALALDTADWERARCLSDQTLAADPLSVIYLAGRALIEYQTGRFAESDEYMERAIRAADSESAGAYAHSNLAAYIIRRSLDTGDLRWIELAESYAREVLSSPSVSRQVTTWGSSVMLGLAVLRNDARAAADHYRTYSNTQPIQHSQPQWSLGLLARTTGNVDLALEHFRKAIDYDRQHGGRFREAWHSYHLAETLMQRGKGTDIQDAVAIIEQTLEMTRHHGMVLLEGRVKALLDGLQQQEAAMQRATGYPDELTRREVEVLRLIAGGMTNKEIGHELFISAKTVGTHVGNIYRKIGTDNRAKATAYALKAGLTEA